MDVCSWICNPFGDLSNSCLCDSFKLLAMHHLKKTFSKKEILLIETMYNHNVTKAEISKELKCSFDRVKRQIEIIEFKKTQNEKTIRNRKHDRNVFLPKTGVLRLHRPNI